MKEKRRLEGFKFKVVQESTNYIPINVVIRTAGRLLDAFEPDGGQDGHDFSYGNHQNKTSMSSDSDSDALSVRQCMNVYQ